MRALMLVVVMAGGCTTVTPHGKAVQTAAYGGGFMAAGTLGLVGGAVALGGVAATTTASTSAPEIKETIIRNTAINAALGAAVSVVVFAVGAIIMNTTTEQLDTVPTHRHREPAPARKDPGGNPYGYQ